MELSYPRSLKECIGGGGGEVVGWREGGQEACVQSESGIRTYQRQTLLQSKSVHFGGKIAD